MPWKAVPNPVRRKRLFSYLKSHPLTSAPGVRRAGFGADLWRLYGNRINTAKRDVGIDMTAYVAKENKNIRAGAADSVIVFLMEHPDASSETVLSSIRTDFYRSGLSLEAGRRAAGIIPPGYVTEAEAAKRVGVTRACVSKRVRGGKIPYVKFERLVYVPENI